LIVAVLVMVCVGCGVRGQGHADVIPAKDVPFGLPGPTTTAADSPPASPTTSATIYLIRSGHLVSVARDLASAGAKDLISALATGPSAPESSAGLRSAISTDVVSNVTVTGPTATIDLSNHFGELPRGDQLLAVGQLVYTLSGVPEVKQLTFRLDERPTAVPRADGTLSDQPVTRDDYRGLLG
jgi:spore germination protein GerM